MRGARQTAGVKRQAAKRDGFPTLPSMSAGRPCEVGVHSARRLAWLALGWPVQRCSTAMHGSIAQATLRLAWPCSRCAPVRARRTRAACSHGESIASHGMGRPWDERPFGPASHPAPCVCSCWPKPWSGPRPAAHGPDRPYAPRLGSAMAARCDAQPG